MENEKYFTGDDLSKLKVVAEDFSTFLLAKEKVDQDIATNPMFIAGMLHGLTSTLLLLNDYVVAGNGEIDREMLKKMHDVISERSKPVTK